MGPGFGGALFTRYNCSESRSDGFLLKLLANGPANHLLDCRLLRPFFSFQVEVVLLNVSQRTSATSRLSYPPFFPLHTSHPLVLSRIGAFARPRFTSGHHLQDACHPAALTSSLPKFCGQIYPWQRQRHLKLRNEPPGAAAASQEEALTTICRRRACGSRLCHPVWREPV